MANDIDTYLRLAKSKGFNVLSLIAKGGHYKATVEGPSGVGFKATLPGSPSDHRGPQNWIRDLKRQENIAIERHAPMQLHYAHQMSDSDIVEARKLLLTLVNDTDLLVLRYEGTPGGPVKWFANKSRTITQGALRPKLPLFLEREGLIEFAEHRGDTKTLYTVTKKGLKAAQTIQSQAPPVPEFPPEPKKLTPSSDDLVSETYQEMVKRTLTERQQLVLEQTDHLTDEELRLMFFYGIEQLKDDVAKKAEETRAEIERQALADIEKLNRMVEKLTC